MDNQGKAGSGKEASNALFYFAVFLLVVSLILFAVNISKVTKITGKATGTINLTVESKTSINFTTSNISWGSGSVTPGLLNATLNTAAGATNVTNGNWTGNTQGLVIENIGNQNVTMDLASGKTNTTLIGGSNPSYAWNFSNVESSSCTNSTPYAWGVFNETNSSTIRICSILQFMDSSDTMRIDFRLRIPSDSLTGALGDIITATATAA